MFHWLCRVPKLHHHGALVNSHLQPAKLADMDAFDISQNGFSTFFNTSLTSPILMTFSGTSTSFCYFLFCIKISRKLFSVLLYFKSTYLLALFPLDPLTIYFNNTF